MKELNTFFNQEFLDRFDLLEVGLFENSTPLSIDKFEAWNKTNDSLFYLKDERANLRKNIKSIFPDFQQGLVLTFNYAPTKKSFLKNSFHRISSYVFHFQGKDYHHVLNEKLLMIENELKKDFPNLEILKAIDTLPILERDFAYQAGLGWIGKNSMLINRKYGSYFLITNLLLGQKVFKQTERKIETDHCGNCNQCITACPTLAINEASRTIEASKCLSYYSIETYKDHEPPKGFEKSRGEIFGCEICQDVCPWNIKSLKNTIEDDSYQKLNLFSFWNQTKIELDESLQLLTKSKFKELFLGTSFFRTRKKGLLKNIKNLLLDNDK